MHKQIIIKAIKEQKKLSIYFKKETSGDYVTRKVSPYDVFPQAHAKTKFQEDILLGYADSDISHKPHPVSIYLKNIHSLVLLDESFNGSELRRILNVKENPNVTRNW